MLYRAGVVHVPALILIGAGHEGEKGVIPNQPCRHLHRVLLPTVAEAVDVVAGGRDADHQLVGVRALRFLEAIVLRRLLVGRHLVRDGEVAVERVLAVRVRGHRHDLDLPVRRAVGLPERVPDRVVDAVVVYLEHLVQLVVLQRKRQEVKRLQRLLQRRRHDVAHRAGMPLDDRHRPGQTRDEAGLAVLPGHLDERLIEAPLVGALVVKPEQVVDDEDFPRLQYERTPQQRLAVQILALRMHQRGLHDIDRHVRLVVAQLQVVSPQIVQEPPTGRDDLLADDHPTGDHILGVLDRDLPEPLSHCLRSAGRVFFQSRHCSWSAPLPGSAACTPPASGRGRASRPARRG